MIKILKPSEEKTEDFLFKIKDAVRIKFPNLYKNLVLAISPVYFNGLPSNFINKIDWDNHKVFDLGSGVTRRHKKIINVDLYPYPEVDLVCDLHQVPVEDNYVDFVISVATLEHVKSAPQVVNEIYRILKPGGGVCCYIPFIQGIHAAPDDYVRYTPAGLITLFSNFRDSRVVIGAGPTSGFVWILQEWLAIFFSFGSVRLYKLFYFLFFILTPLKFLDILLCKHPMASNISSGFTITAFKPLDGQHR